MVGSSLKPSHSYILCHKIDTMDFFNPLENNSPLHHPKTTKIIELAVVAYGVGVIPLIKWLNEAYPDVKYPWYAGNEGELGTYDKIELYFNFLKRFGPGRGYYPDPSKIVLIVHPENIEVRKLLVFSHEFNVCNGARYIGSFIAVDEYKHD